jgi:hypothetical protein
MRTRVRQNYSSGAPGWGDKSNPPEFLLRKQAPAERAGWWKGLAPRGKIVVVASSVVVAAVIAGVCLSFTLPGSASKTPGVRHPKVIVRPKPKPGPRLSFSLSKNSEGIELAVLTFGLKGTMKQVGATAKALNADLSSTYGAGDPSSMSARLEILADGPDGGQTTEPEGPVSAPGVEISDRYTRTYKTYLARVDAVNTRARGLILFPGDAARRKELVGLCDQLSRDLSVVIDGLNRLRAPGSEDTSDIVRGIQAANARLSVESQRLDRFGG